jgi:hypothetical protein
MPTHIVLTYPHMCPQQSATPWVSLSRFPVHFFITHNHEVFTFNIREERQVFNWWQIPHFIVTYVHNICTTDLHLYIRLAIYRHDPILPDHTWSHRSHLVCFVTQTTMYGWHVYWNFTSSFIISWKHSYHASCFIPIESSLTGFYYAR